METALWDSVSTRGQTCVRPGDSKMGSSLQNSRARQGPAPPVLIPAPGPTDLKTYRKGKYVNTAPWERTVV